MAIENEQFEMLMMETMEKSDKTVSVLNSEYVTIPIIIIHIANIFLREILSLNTFTPQNVT